MNRSGLGERVLLDCAELGFRDVLVVGRYSYKQAQPSLKLHVHNGVYEICLLQEGVQTFFVGHHRYDLTGGDLLITRPGEAHGTLPEPLNKGCLYWVQLRTCPPVRPLLGLSADESRLLLKRFERLSFRHLRHAEALLPCLERAFEVFHDTRNPMRAADLRNLLLRFVLDVLALAEHREVPAIQAGIRRALAHIDAHQASLLSVATLARVASMSESHFKKLFKRQVGTSPIEYAMRCRIEKSKQMLQKTSPPITRIAMDLGFSTSQHFACVFRRFTGLTPRQYRQRAAIPQGPQGRMIPESGSGPSFHPVMFASA